MVDYTILLENYNVCHAWLPAVIGAVGSIASGIIAARANKKAADSTNNLQREMYYDQQQYNTPSEQMARYRMAGLNPHLIYTQSNANSQAIPAAVTPNYDAAAQGAMSAFQGFQGSLNQGIEADLLRSQNENQIINNRMALIDEKIKNIDLNWYEIEKKTNNEFLRQQIRQCKVAIRRSQYEIKRILPQQYKNLVSQQQYTDEQKSNILWSQLFSDKQFQLECQKLGLQREQMENSQWVQQIAKGFMQSLGISSFKDLGKFLGKNSLGLQLLNYITSLIPTPGT